jgi:hypothetical protein
MSNVGLYKYKTDAIKTDCVESDDENNLTEEKSSEETKVPMEQVVPALENTHWKKILDYRFIISAPSRTDIDISNFFEEPRFLSICDSSMAPFEIKISELGVISKQ